MADLNDNPFEKELIGLQSELLRFASKLTADQEKANDLLQETLLKALDNKSKYLPETNFKGWVFTIMRNIFINDYRKEVRDQTFIDKTEDKFHINSNQSADSSSFSEYAYDIKEIYRLLASLSDEYRIPFTMHIAGFKYREIADKLGLPLGTVKSRIFFTRQKLQDIFKDFQ
jgi:RNA polymerase sigma-70 factor (ECF subfamily)